MVDNFIRELKDISMDSFNDDERYIFFLGLTKLIDNFSRSSKAEMRKEFFKIKDEYSEEGAIFFELFPDIKIGRESEKRIIQILNNIFII